MLIVHGNVFGLARAPMLSGPVMDRGPCSPSRSRNSLCYWLL